LPRASGPTRDGARERILAAALEVFAERGFDGARTREIAERAAANLGLIKYYFNDKERQWKAAVARAFGELQVGLADAVQPSNGADGTGTLAALDRSLRDVVRFVAGHPEFMRLVNDQSRPGHSAMRRLAARF